MEAVALPQIRNDARSRLPATFFIPPYIMLLVLIDTALRILTLFLDYKDTTGNSLYWVYAWALIMFGLCLGLIIGGSLYLLRKPAFLRFMRWFLVAFIVPYYFIWVALGPNLARYGFTYGGGWPVALLWVVLAVVGRIYFMRSRRVKEIFGIEVKESAEGEKGVAPIRLSDALSGFNGGLLILAAIMLLIPIVGLFSTGYATVVNIGVYKMHRYTHYDSVLWFYASLNGGFFLATAYAAVSFLRKKKHASKLIMTLMAVFVLINLLCTAIFSDLGMMPLAETGRVVRWFGAAIAVIGIPYFLFSKQIKATFVR